ncbi:FAD-dependent monooxygenase [Kutzneria sp. CA-103260]|uniref:FAD-dependent monooxygenase n=1 Tax=Kutzneria sp. CA-103260 TaxID=2802641 RepID=UPI001BACE8AF|nr:FAD-dependent monooxygenase [Kutzneria sp. CA-103260]QUQ64531.1 oxidoreductase [Kutzneria sp. CA-103260]
MRRVAGLSLALDLGGRGHHVTVVERANQFRVSGSSIDVRGDALDIADRMGLLARIKENRVRATELSVFVDADGRGIGQMSWSEFDVSDHDIDIAREDLAQIMIDALPAGTTVRLREHLESLADDGAGVDVRFASGGTGRFALVLGADGQHSAVRCLAFGAEKDYLRHLGLYVALAELPGERRADRLNPVYNFLGHMATIWRYKDRALAGFAFRPDLVRGLGYEKAHIFGMGCGIRHQLGERSPTPTSPLCDADTTAS